MNSLATLVGQPRAVSVLRAALAGGKVHHGYLFEGPDGVGKATCARALAMALNCTRSGSSDGCGECDACHKIDAGVHPDVIRFDMTGKGLTERVRELVGTVGFRPHEGRARVVVFDPAHQLSPIPERAEAANVLLKTLEEPPSGTHFVLVTAEPRRLPLTVRSRCQRIRFQPLEDGVIERWLVENQGATAGAAREAAARAAGSLGRAVAELAESEPGDPAEEASPRRTREWVELLVSAARKSDPRALFQAAAEIGEERERAEATCELLWTVLRDALLVREQVDRGRVSAARADFAGQLLGDRPSAALFVALRETRETVRSLRGNVAPALALEHLLLALGAGGRSAGALR